MLQIQLDQTDLDQRIEQDPLIASLAQEIAAFEQREKEKQEKFAARIDALEQEVAALQEQQRSIRKEIKRKQGEIRLNRHYLRQRSPRMDVLRRRIATRKKVLKGRAVRQATVLARAAAAEQLKIN